jgi:hypothetical protein
VGVRGESNTNTGIGVLGYSNNNVGVSAGTLGGTAVLASSVGGTALKGNSSSGYALDISGKVKIAGGNTNPSNGAVLTSDAEGNAVWKARRVAFHASGVNTNYESVPHGSWRRMHFTTTGFYDASGSYNLLVGTDLQPNSSTFTAPVAGIYHFDVAVRFSVLIINDAPVVTDGDLVLKKNSGGTVSNLFWKSGGDIFNDSNISAIQMMLSKDVFLQAGEMVYVEARHFNQDQKSLFLGGAESMFFSGHLVIAL